MADATASERDAKDFAERSEFRKPTLFIPAECPGCGEGCRDYGFLVDCSRCSKTVCESCATSGLCPDCDVDASVERMEAEQEAETDED